jgi:phosphoenolpyruvate carboxykinase (ATP)
VEGGVLDPRSAWADKKAYDAQRLKLGGMFQKNYTKYVHPGVTDYSKHGPKV